MTTSAGARLSLADELAHAGAILGAETSTMALLRHETQAGIDELRLVDGIAATSRPRRGSLPDIWPAWARQILKQAHANLTARRLVLADMVGKSHRDQVEVAAALIRHGQALARLARVCDTLLGLPGSDPLYQPKELSGYT